MLRFRTTTASGQIKFGFPGQRTIVPLVIGNLLLMFAFLNSCSGTVSGRVLKTGVTVDAKVVAAREDQQTYKDAKGQETTHYRRYITFRFNAPGHGVIHEERIADEWLWQRFKHASEDSPIEAKVVYVSPRSWYEVEELADMRRSETIALWVLPLLGLLFVTAGVVNLVVAQRKKARHQTPSPVAPQRYPGGPPPSA